MPTITVYTVQVQGTCDVQADNTDQAKQRALEHFAQTPMKYISVIDTKQVITPPPTP